jgi:hypothetical protein
MGHVRSRFSSRLHANSPVCSPNIPCKSFPKKILPVTLTRLIICAGIYAKSMNVKNFGGKGGGSPT